MTAAAGMPPATDRSVNTDQTTALRSATA